MLRALLISVRFHEGRYYGAGDWPPAPARLFQAFVAGAARGGMLAGEDVAALRWLEELRPPVIAAPAVRTGSGFRNYVPNNDLDAVGGDLRRIGEIRTPKSIGPRLFDAAQPFLRGVCGAARRGPRSGLSPERERHGHGNGLSAARLVEEP